MLISFIAGIISLIILLGVIPLGGLLAMALGLLYMSLPAQIKPVYALILGLVGIPMLMVVFLFINAAFLPLAVFFKTFNLKFISRVSEKYNVFIIGGDHAK